MRADCCQTDVRWELQVIDSNFDWDCSPRFRRSGTSRRLCGYRRADREGGRSAIYGHGRVAASRCQAEVAGRRATEQWFVSSASRKAAKMILRSIALRLH